MLVIGKLGCGVYGNSMYYLHNISVTTQVPESLLPFEYLDLEFSFLDHKLSYAFIMMLAVLHLTQGVV